MAFTLAPTMSWPDAMGLVVLEGLGICLLVVTGLRQKIMDAIPLALKKAIGVGIGLFIALIGLVDSGFVGKGDGTPVTLGAGGTLKGWPMFIFCLGVVLTLTLMVRRVPGAILSRSSSTTVLAIVINKVATVPAAEWGLIEPKVPHKLFAAPDFGLLGKFSLFGGFGEAGVVTRIVFVFTLILADFFDAMGTIIGVSGEAGLLDSEGRLPSIGRVLFIDGLAASAGGIGIGLVQHLLRGVRRRCRRGRADGSGERRHRRAAVPGRVHNPLATVVPSQAATPALVAVGFLMMTQAKDIPWDDWEIAIPAFLTLALMPFTYSITNGIGAGFIMFVVLKAAVGKVREVNWLMWVVAAFFVAYFALDPIKQWLGIS